MVSPTSAFPAAAALAAALSVAALLALTLVEPAAASGHELSGPDDPRAAAVFDSPDELSVPEFNDMAMQYLIDGYLFNKWRQTQMQRSVAEKRNKLKNCRINAITCFGRRKRR